MYRRREKLPRAETHSASPPTSSTSGEVPQSVDLPIAFCKGVRSCTQHPIDQVVSFSHLSPTLCSFVCALSFVSVPKSHTHALTSPGWKSAMDEKMLALSNNGTWELADLLSGKQVVGCRWVYVVKYQPGGTLE